MSDIDVKCAQLGSAQSFTVWKLGSVAGRSHRSPEPKREGPMIRLLTSSAVFAICMVFGSIGPAIAQVPPHTPGTICATPNFWCWAQPPGPPGATCFCPTPQGSVRGVLQ
jgi:hypothetical protein